MTYEEYMSDFEGAQASKIRLINRTEYPEHITKYVNELADANRHFLNEYDMETLAEGIVYQTAVIANINRILTANGTDRIIYKEHQDIVNQEISFIKRKMELIKEAGASIDLYEDENGGVAIVEQDDTKLVTTPFYPTYEAYLDRLFQEITKGNLEDEIYGSFFDVQSIYV